MPQRLVPGRSRDLTRSWPFSGHLLVALALVLGTMTLGLQATDARTAAPPDQGVHVAGWAINGSGEDDSTPGADEAATPVADDDATPGADEGTPVAGGTPAAGGSGVDEDAGTYTSPAYGYSLAFSPDDWLVLGELQAAENAGRDRIDLTNEDETSTLLIEGSEEWADTDECVDVLLAEIGVDPAIIDPVEDPETGDTYEISEDGRSAVAYSASDGDEGATVLIDCRQDEGSDVIVGFTNLSLEFEDYFGVAYPAVEDILDSLEF